MLIVLRDALQQSRQAASSKKDTSSEARFARPDALPPRASIPDAPPSQPRYGRPTKSMGEFLVKL